MHDGKPPRSLAKHYEDEILNHDDSGLSSKCAGLDMR